VGRSRGGSEVGDRVHIVGCGVLRLDLTRLAEELQLTYSCEFLKGGLHEEPAELRRCLQAGIDRAPAGSDRIVVGYGLCGRGTVGIEAREVPLVMPRVQDCIALFLGSDGAYRREFKRAPGTYYISAGWYEGKVEPLGQRPGRAYLGKAGVSEAELIEQYGEEKAEAVWSFLNSWQQNYQRAVFVDTGAADGPAAAQHAQAMAARYGWEYERLEGSTGLLEKLLTSTVSDGDVLVVPRGHLIGYDAVGGAFEAVPVGGGGVERGSSGQACSVGAAAGEPARVCGEGRVQGGVGGARYGLGIDAGGTYTDAVIYDLVGQRVVAKAKALTTRWDYAVGIEDALERLGSSIVGQVQLVSVSTTLATNAIVEGQGQKVGLLVMPPYGLFDGADIAHEPKAVINGRLEIDGEELEGVNEGEVRSVVRRMVSSQQVKAFAVSGFAGSINPAHELLVKRIVVEETGLGVTCGHELSAMLNFRTRAQTAVLNARIIPRLEKLLTELGGVLGRRGLAVPVMVVKGDGTLIGSGVAQDRPVETVLSGPAASVAGAAHLTGETEALVVDMGGTTTDTAMLRGGEVSVCEEGTRVGSFATHVRALEMRTAGLGGDSLVGYHGGELSVGPVRVSPAAWGGCEHEGFGAALDFLGRRLEEYRESTQPMQVVLLSGRGGGVGGGRLTGGSGCGLSLTRSEQGIVDRLLERPYSLDELAGVTHAGHWSVLRLGRLEEYGIVQRCGLTPTDLLHVRGEFLRWDVVSARRMTELTAAVAGVAVEAFVEGVLKQVVRRLAVELLKRQLDEETSGEVLESCPVCGAFLSHLLDGVGEDFSLSIECHRPVVGIGAPAGWFIPRAASLLNARAIICEDADVANAIGAITSNVVVRHAVRIKPDGDGGYSVEGLADAPRFGAFSEAELWARERLEGHVRSMGVLAGAHGERVCIEAADQRSMTADGHEIFIGRTLEASLIGLPVG